MSVATATARSESRHGAAAVVNPGRLCRDRRAWSSWPPWSSRTPAGQAPGFGARRRERSAPTFCTIGRRPGPAGHVPDRDARPVHVRRWGMGQRQPKREPVVGDRRGPRRGGHRLAFRAGEHHRDRPHRQGRDLGSSPGVVEALWAAPRGRLRARPGGHRGRAHRAEPSRDIVGAHPRVDQCAALPGAACLLVAAAFAVALTNGGAWLALGLVGFVVWLVFMVAASISLLRKPQIP